MERGDGPIGLTLYRALVIKIYNHSYEEYLPARLTLNRLSRLKGINPAKFDEKYDFVFIAEKQCHHVPKNYDTNPTRNPEIIGGKAAGLDIKNHDFFSW